MSNCLNCGKLLKNTKGKRPKKYCDDNCRQRYFQKNKNKKATPKKKKKAKPVPHEAPLSAEIKKTPAKQSNPLPVDGVGYFMGQKIPEGLKGIDLSIWKNEIKEKCK